MKLDQWLKNHSDCMKPHIGSRYTQIDARRYAAQFGTLAELWDSFTYVAWMIWVLGYVVPNDDQRYRLFACWCVRNTPVAHRNRSRLFVLWDWFMRHTHPEDGRIVWDLLDQQCRDTVEFVEQLAWLKATQDGKAKLFTIEPHPGVMGNGHCNEFAKKTGFNPSLKSDVYARLAADYAIGGNPIDAEKYACLTVFNKSRDPLAMYRAEKVHANHLREMFAADIAAKSKEIEAGIDRT